MATTNNRPKVLSWGQCDLVQLAPYVDFWRQSGDSKETLRKLSRLIILRIFKARGKAGTFQKSQAKIINPSLST